jgi:ubiquitin-protein ligase
MAALKRLNKEIATFSQYDISNNFLLPYKISWINLDIDFFDKTNQLAKISIDVYNNCLLNIDIPTCYPFKSPIVWVNNTKNFKQYSKYCADITEIINKRTFLSTSDIILAWLFALTSSYKNKTYNNLNIPKSLPLSCFCCNSITCSSKWSPGFKIQDIIYEFIFIKKFLFFSSQLGLRYINPIFNNENWSIPDDLILHIFKFIY